MASTLIGATTTDVWVFGAATLATVAALLASRHRVLLLMLDPEMAGAVGMRVGLWEGAIYAWLGLLVGVSIHAAGMVYAFGCLVLPALVAKTFCREVWSIFVVSPLIALGAGFVAFVLANHHDYPPGQLTVAVLSTLLLVSRIARSLVERHSGRRSTRS
jgi:ABC-type Mn2+/Zn2+ transport system permease subunit